MRQRRRRSWRCWAGAMHVLCLLHVLCCCWCARQGLGVRHAQLCRPFPPCICVPAPPSPGCCSPVLLYLYSSGCGGDWALPMPQAKGGSVLTALMCVWPQPCIHCPPPSPAPLPAHSTCPLPAAGAMAQHPVVWAWRRQQREGTYQLRSFRQHACNTRRLAAAAGGMNHHSVNSNARDD